MKLVCIHNNFIFKNNSLLDLTFILSLLSINFKTYILKIDLLQSYLKKKIKNDKSNFVHIFILNNDVSAFISHFQVK